MAWEDTPLRESNSLSASFTIIAVEGWAASLRSVPASRRQPRTQTPHVYTLIRPQHFGRCWLFWHLFSNNVCAQTWFRLFHRGVTGGRRRISRVCCWLFRRHYWESNLEKKWNQTRQAAGSFRSKSWLLNTCTPKVLVFMRLLLVKCDQVNEIASAHRCDALVSVD